MRFKDTRFESITTRKTTKLRRKEGVNMSKKRKRKRRRRDRKKRKKRARR